MGTRSGHIAYVGVDVSKDKLWVCWSEREGEVHEFDVDNDEAGVEDLLARTTGGHITEARIVVEATGPYSAQLVAAAAAHAIAQVMRIRPASGKQFAQLVARAKTDRVDARALHDYARRMEFVPTQLPSDAALQIRDLARHMGKVIDRRAAIKNQRHASDIANITNIAWAIQDEVEALDLIINKLEAQIVEALAAHDDPLTQAAYDHFLEVSGVAVRATTRLLPELMCLPRSLTPRQVVAHAGLDPRPRTSGTSRQGESWPISKMGNSRIRRMLYMSTLSAVRHDPALRAFHDGLVARGKPKKVAMIAAMRKLLIALWSMYVNGEAYAPTKLTSRIAA